MQKTYLSLLVLLAASMVYGRNIDLSTVPDRATVQLTIYNSEDLTLVRETRKVSFKKGVNPLGSCWVMLLQMPVFMGLWYALQESIQFRLAPFWPTWIENLAAPIQVTRALLPALRAQPEATIVNVGSAFGRIPFAGFAAYSASKGGLHAFSQALRRELADSRVRVLHVSPRAIDTPLNSPAVVALNRALGNASDTPEHAAARIVRLLANNGTEAVFGFPERIFAWLNSLSPALIDRGVRGKLATIKLHAASR